MSQLIYILKPAYMYELLASMHEGKPVFKKAHGDVSSWTCGLQFGQSIYLFTFSMYARSKGSTHSVSSYLSRAEMLDIVGRNVRNIIKNSITKNRYIRPHPDWHVPDVTMETLAPAPTSTQEQLK